MGSNICAQHASVGANIEEAQAAESRADFVHKLGIAQKEARESFFWLRLLAESEIVPKRHLSSLTRETEELIAVITSIIVSTKRKRALILKSGIHNSQFKIQNS